MQRSLEIIRIDDISFEQYLSQRYCGGSILRHNIEPLQSGIQRHFFLSRKQQSVASNVDRQQFITN